MINELRQRLLNEWGGWITTVYDVTQLSQLQDSIPSEWLRIADTSCADVIAQLWSEAREVLPRFVEYLSQSTLTMMVGLIPRWSTTFRIGKNSDSPNASANTKMALLSMVPATRSLQSINPFNCCCRSGDNFKKFFFCWYNQSPNWEWLDTFKYPYCS